MQSKGVLQPHSGRDRDSPSLVAFPPPAQAAPFSSAPPLVTPTLRGLGAGDLCILRQPRIAGYVKPCASACSSSSLPSERIPSEVPLISKLFKSRALPLPKLTFHGWGKPIKQWKDWVHDMAGEDTFVNVWRAAGIEDAILNSTVTIRKANQTMVALLGFWCPSTSTFVLPWGEVSFTLEDAHILGNLPVWGNPLQRQLTEEEERLRLRLVNARGMLVDRHKKSVNRAKVSHASWLDWFVRIEDDDELRHLGFLSYWLSKSVVSCKPLYEVPSAVFGIAARLSRGERIAFAPAVTANIYTDLTFITKSLYECQGEIERTNIEIWGQFRLLQAWLWERFDGLSPIAQDKMISHQSRVRIARWDNKQRKVTYYEAVEVLSDFQSFEWRPYISEIANWVKPPWCDAREDCNVVVEECSPIWVYDVLAIVTAAGLVGLATEETIPMGQYKPYRVSMQLGYDQAIPTSTDQLVTPWDSSTVRPRGIELYIPAVTRKGSTLKGYAEWWDECATALALSGMEFEKNLRKKRRISDAYNEVDNKNVSKHGQRKNKRQMSNAKMEYFSGGQEESDSEGRISDACNQVSSKNVSKNEKRKKKRQMSNAKMEYASGGQEKSDSEGRISDDYSQVNSKNVSKNDKRKKKRLLSDAKGKYKSNSEERSHGEGGLSFEKRCPNCTGDPISFVQKPANCSGDANIRVPCDEAHDVINVDDSEVEDTKPKYHEHGSRSCGGVIDELDFDDILVDELEDFLSKGLQAELMPQCTSPSSDGSSERHPEYGHKDATSATITGDNISEEVIRAYPNFFRMIPQHPHFLGLLHVNVDEGMKKIVYSLLFYKVVELMQKAIETTCQTKVCEIEQLMKEARCLEKLGFDVRHLLARLKQPEKRIKKLNLAKMHLEKVRERMKKVENHCLAHISRTHMSHLRKALNDAELRVFESEWDVDILGKRFNLK